MSYAWRASELAACPATVAPGTTISVVSERYSFDALEPEWNDLFRRAGRDAQLFQSFNWSWHWANHYLAPGQPGQPGRLSLAVVTLRREGRLVMLWPLVSERVAGLSVLRWMGEPVSQYGDALCESGPDSATLMRTAWQFITTRLGADAIVLRKVRADAAVAPLFREIGLKCTGAEEAPFLDLASAPDFAAYEQRYSAKARKNRRRLMRRLEERGRVAVVRHISGAEARAASLAGVALKRASLAATGQLAPALADPRFAAFFADVAEARTRPAGCGLTVLESNGEIAGVAIDISSGGRRAAHILVHDPQLDGCGAGVLLVQEWIRGASADGIATFDFLAPAHAYKMDWADGVVAVEDFALGLTLSGRIYTNIYVGLLRERLKTGAEVWSRTLSWLQAAGVAVGW
jgi:CelD/BcsL family acetyltransferase involved in cellulose biosynthesis